MIKISNIPGDLLNTGVRSYLLRVFCFTFLGIVFLAVVGCSSAASEQATVEQLTLEAIELANKNTESTVEAEKLAATAQAIEDVNTTLEAMTREADEEARLQATADSEATQEAVAAANERATAEAQAAAEAEATANALATVSAQATAEAEAFATASFEATREAFVGAQLDLMRNAQQENPVVEMEEGVLLHDDEDEPELQAVDVELRNFVVSTQFAFDPGETDLDRYDFGLGFRSAEGSATYLLLKQDGSWQLIDSEEGSNEVIQEGQAGALQDGWNELDLYVDEDNSFFCLNGEYIEALDLDRSAEKGDIVLVTGMGDGAEADGASVQLKELQVWSMDPIPPTPTPAPTSSTPPQPAPPSAHRFPETPVKPFDRDEFVSFVGQLRDSLRSYKSEMDLMKTTHKPGDCGTFYGWLGLWRRQSPYYTDVPASFASLHREYRSLLNQVVGLSEEIRMVCDAGGGFVSDETINAINEFLSWAYPRSEQMVAEASALPGP